MVFDAHHPHASQWSGMPGSLTYMSPPLTGQNAGLLALQPAQAPMTSAGETLQVSSRSRAASDGISPVTASGDYCSLLWHSSLKLVVDGASRASIPPLEVLLTNDLLSKYGHTLLAKQVLKIPLLHQLDYVSHVPHLHPTQPLPWQHCMG